MPIPQALALGALMLGAVLFWCVWSRRLDP